MAKSEKENRINSNTIAWVLIGLAVVAVVLGLWDLLIEQDGGSTDSIIVVVIGICVGALGFKRLKR